MIVYKIDKPIHMKASSRIKDMQTVLDEISTSLKILNEALVEHQESISTPSIDAYRDKLQQMTGIATELTKSIADKSRQLVAASDQATKHLVAIDEHFGAVLRDGSKATAEKSKFQ